MDYARPSVDDLINNLPCVLKSSRQFLPWNRERDGPGTTIEDSSQFYVARSPISKSYTRNWNGSTVPHENCWLRRAATEDELVGFGELRCR